MGKLPASLLSIVFHLYLIETVFADEQVRKAQEELCKRHLFYGNANGEVTPALTVAISAYQEKKGFIRSGRLDLETCASLGLMRAPAKSVRIDPSFVFADADELRGANGEALPNSVMADPSRDEPYVELTGTTANAELVALATAGDDAASLITERRAASPRSRVRPRQVQARRPTNPFMSAFQTVDHAIRLFVGDPQPKKKRPATSRL